MAPTLPRTRFFALLYGTLGVAFAGFAVAYTLDGQTLAGGIFAFLAVAEFVLAGWYASNPEGIENPDEPTPSGLYGYLLVLIAVGLLVWAGIVLYPHLV